jgi:hypothetical protein
MVYQNGMPLTQIANNSHDITSLQSFQNQWQAVGNQINGISEAMMGETPPSGTAWRLQEAVLNESHSLFELMTENKGLSLIEMLTKYVIPYLKKKMDTTEEIAEILTDYQIEWIDSKFVPNQIIARVNDEKKRIILGGQIYDTGMEESFMQSEQQAIEDILSKQGNQRFIKPSDIKGETWKKSLEDLEWELDYDITGESRDTRSAMTTLSSVLQTIAGLQGQPMSPEMKLVFDKILNLTGSISPLEISQMNAQKKQAQPMPAVVGTEAPVVPEIK